MAGTFVWDTLSDKGKNHQFVINRYHTVKHYYLDTGNRTVSILQTFALDIDEPKFWLHASQNEKYVLTNNLAGIAPLSTSAIDTLYCARYYIDAHNQPQYTPPYLKLARIAIEK